MLLDGIQVPAWQHRMVEIIQMSDYADIRLVVRSVTPAKDSKPVPPQAYPASTSSNGLRRRVLKRIERILIGRPSHLPDAETLMECSSLLADAVMVDITPLPTGSVDVAAHAMPSPAREAGIDVFIKLGARCFQGAALDAARFGVWSYEHGEVLADDCRVPGYMEVMQSVPIVESTLRISSNAPFRSQVLSRTYSTTNVMSLKGNAHNIYWKILHLVPRQLKELHTAGEEKFFAGLDNRNRHPEFRDGPRVPSPSNAELGVFLIRKFAQKVSRKVSDLFYFDQWFLLFDIQQEMSTSLGRFKFLAPPKDRKWADPFVVARDGKYFIFIEELIHGSQKGHISVIVMDNAGHVEPPISVLATPFHLSYPFIFEFENETYMIPESVADEAVKLYKCTAFPLKWEFQKNLIQNRRAIDSTLIERDGVWWLFTNQIETLGASPWDELFLYYSDSPLSDNWIAHPNNPIVSDARSARPAGRLFVHNNRLYRPSQNCSGHYGYGFNICEVVKLSKTEYEETVVSRVEPKWNKHIVSTHTFNYEGGLTVIDGQLRRRK